MAKLGGFKPAGILEWRWYIMDLQHEYEINPCYRKLLRFESCLLLAHNISYPDWYKWGLEKDQKLRCPCGDCILHREQEVTLLEYGVETTPETSCWGLQWIRGREWGQEMATMGVVGNGLGKGHES